MTEARDQELDVVVARSLRWGAYIAFAILLTGLLSTPFLSLRTTFLVDTVGVLVMMSTPAFRVLIAIIVFLRERDYKYTLVATGVLLILLLGSIFGVGEH
jgi:uncharacterized membrane protein